MKHQLNGMVSIELSFLRKAVVEIELSSLRKDAVEIQIFSLKIAIQCPSLEERSRLWPLVRRNFLLTRASFFGQWPPTGVRL